MSTAGHYCRGLARRTFRHFIAFYGHRPWSWKTRACLHRSISIISRATIRVDRMRQELVGTIRLAGQLSGTILWSLGSAAAVIAGIWILESVVAVPLTVDGETYNTLLQTIAGVTGVFLALYFTAVSTVAATAYAEVPTETRDLLVREKLGNTYVRVVAFVAAFSIALLGLHAAGKGPWLGAIAVAVFGAALSIFAFGVLGRRAFQFFDPIAVAQLAIRDLSRSARAYSGLRNRRAAVRVSSARADARRAVEAINALVDLTRNRRGPARARLLRQVLGSMSGYLFQKISLPTESAWFATRYEHRQWYLSESTVLELAVSSSTSLIPEQVPDLEWLEKEIARIVRRGIVGVNGNPDLETLGILLPGLVELGEVAGLTLEVRPNLIWTADLLDVAITALRGGHVPQNQDRSFSVGLADDIGRFLLSIELGVFRRVADFDVGALDNAVRTTDLAAWSSAYRLAHRFGFPRAALRSLERVAQGMTFEDAAATGVRTPRWYARDLVMNSLLWAFHEEWKAAVDFSIKNYLDATKELEEAGCHLEAAAVRSRGLEASWKIVQHVERVNELDGQLRALPVLRDLQAPAWDAKTVVDEITGFRRELIKGMASSVVDLMQVPRNPDLPDYLGEAVQRAGEACFDALDSNQFPYFAEVFGHYFLGILAIADRIRPQVTRWWPQTAGPWVAAPVVDLVTISGYAFVFSSLTGNDSPRSKVEEYWNKWLSGNADRLKIVDAMMGVESTTYAILPRAGLRLMWESRLMEKLAALPRRKARREWIEGQVDHPDALIRALSPSSLLMGLSYTAAEVFVALFLRRRPNASDLDFGLRGARADHLEFLLERIQDEGPDPGDVKK